MVFEDLHVTESARRWTSQGLREHLLETVFFPESPADVSEMSNSGILGMDPILKLGNCVLFCMGSFQ